MLENADCGKEEIQCVKPGIEPVLIQSVICSKKVRVVSASKTEIKKSPYEDVHVRFSPDAHSIKVEGILMKDFIILQGSITGSLFINECFTERITLLFQEELFCEGVCPGDVLKITKPILEGSIPPQEIKSFEKDSCTFIFKIILSMQVTAIREKIGDVAVTIYDDVNEDRCISQTHNEAVVTCKADQHHHSKPQHSNYPSQKQNYHPATNGVNHNEVAPEYDFNIHMNESDIND